MLLLAAWATAHRRAVVAIWLGIVVAGVATAFGFGSRYANDFHLPATDSQRARMLFAQGFPSRATDANQIVVHARVGTLDDAALHQRVGAMLLRVEALPRIVAVESPFASRPAALSHDRTIGIANVVVARASTSVQNAAMRAVMKVASRFRSRSLQIEFGGPTVEQAQKTGVGSSMVVGLVAAVIVLLLSFGSLLAMGLPLATALVGLGTGVGLVALVSRAIPMPTFSEELALMIGLGVGVDYALFIVTRYRESYAASGGNVMTAVAVAVDTAGRAVLFAGLTVVFSLLGMCALGISFLYGPAVASAIAVLLVLAASVTLLPALLATFGHRIGRLGRIARRLAPRSDGGSWMRWIDMIEAHPWLAAGAAAAALFALASPVLALRLGGTDAGSDPTSLTTRRAYDLVAHGFGSGFSGPLLIAAHLPEQRRRAAVVRLVTTLRHTNDVVAVTPPHVNQARGIAAVIAIPASSPQSPQTERLVSQLRHRVLPPLARSTGATFYVGGFTAVQIDFAAVVGAKLWLFILSVTLVSALVLLVVFRSFVIPLQAALMNLLSIGSSLGVVVAVFQWGWLQGLVGISGGPVQAFLPVMVFALVFGLSMDYEIFLVSRIHEEWVHGKSSRDAIRLGLVRSGRVVTAAAAVMVAVFASFTLSSDRTVSLFGVGLATAVFLDAVVIRCLLLPAVLELLGRATWWFPAWLDGVLPKLAIEPPEEELEALLAARPASPAATRAA